MQPDVSQWCVRCFAKNGHVRIENFKDKTAAECFAKATGGSVSVAPLQLLTQFKERIEMKQIKIKYLDPNMPKLEYIDGKSDWIDLRAAESVNLAKGDFRLIPLGIAMKLPDGYEAHIVPRSSTFKKWGIIQTNHMGVIDGSYSGDNDQWMMPVYATRDVKIEKYERICQFRIVKNQPPIRFDEVAHLNGANRGGFGSTGTF